MKYKGKFIYEITKHDVGKEHRFVVCPTCEHRKLIMFGFMGGVLDCDVGKRIYEISGIYQVENDEQLENRTQNKRRLLND